MPMHPFITVIFLVLLAGCGYYIEPPTTSLVKHRNIRSAFMEMSPIKCNKRADNDLNETQRFHIINIINRFRSIIHSSSLRHKWKVVPTSNYRKVKYSCVHEAELKFECNDNLNPEDFKSDRYTWRRVQEISKRHSSLSDWDPRVQEKLFDPFNHSIMHAADEADTLRMALSPDVTLIGCFERTCNGYKYIACTTGHSIDVDSPLYTPSKRCKDHSDCTLPGYKRCDAALGLCDSDLQYKSNVPPLVCLTSSSPHTKLRKEKCNRIYDTGSDISQAERNKITVFINEYRATINNNCTLGLGIPKPAANYRKVKYSCALEMESRFECSSDLNTKPFKSDETTWRNWGISQNPNTRQAIYHRSAPYLHNLNIDPETQTDNDNSFFAKFFMSADVTEVGCYVKVCYKYEFIACKTNHDHSMPNYAPLYTPGQRCNVDADCTLPGYRTCDSSVGLCDYKNHLEINKEAALLKCENVRSIFVYRSAEPCGPGYDTGSDIGNKERDIIVYVVNHFRKLINNNCDLGKGVVRPISNYRKVEYSCALEKEASFKCSDVNPDNFRSSKYIQRGFGQAQSGLHKAKFAYWAPWNHDMLIDPYNQTSTAGANIQTFLRLVISPEVTEIGCFIKKCGEFEYMACKTGHIVVAPPSVPLYKPGNRCLADEDCTLPDYGICDTESGMCELS